jgi:hypothetical protein
MLTRQDVAFLRKTVEEGQAALTGSPAFPRARRAPVADPDGPVAAPDPHDIVDDYHRRLYGGG